MTESGRYDAVVSLGAVIRGETPISTTSPAGPAAGIMRTAMTPVSRWCSAC
ncbi:MAG: hypothetical protein Ct9H300mP12_17160 [Acidimicrobiales bacterium]|nr:MAG: hypothetical protein Ct9H300mP12_17160 [Acidimicrobiales bacterium]